MDEETVRIFPYAKERPLKMFDGNVVDVDQDKAGIAGDVRRGSSSFEGDGGDDGRLALLDLCLSTLEGLRVRGFAHPLGVMERQVGLPVKEGGVGMCPVGQLLKDRRPGGRRGSRRSQ